MVSDSVSNRLLNIPEFRRPRAFPCCPYVEMRHDFLRRPASKVFQAFQGVSTVQEFERVAVHGKELGGLREAITHVEALAGVSFWTDVFPRICDWLQDQSLSQSVPLLLSGSSGNIEFTNKQVRSILAHAFCFNCLSTGISQDGFGILDFSSIFFVRGVGSERTKCLLLFFVQEIRQPLPRKTTISRFSQSEEDFPDWKQCDAPICSDVRIHAGRMEDCLDTPPAQADQSRATIVDFANKQIHIGRIIPSMTQEEVLFSCASECFLTLLTCEQLKANEVVVVRNVRRAVDYSGYLSTFTVTKMLTDPPLMDILVLDASYMDSFSPKQIIRDLNKAWIGFSNCVVSPISTGHWGCGAFGGNKTLKFLQQLCAASLTGLPLEYSTFQENDTQSRFQNLHSELVKNSVTVRQVVQMMLDYKRTDGSFEIYCTQWLSRHIKTK